MTSRGFKPMQITRISRAIGILAAVAVAGCSSLDVKNPNAPDAKRALADPTALESVAGGTMRSWFNTFEGCEGNCVLTTQAQTFSASWNNWNMNFYGSIDADGTRNTRPWQNDPAAAGRTSVEVPWVGMYAAISSAADVLKAIRINKTVINNAADTKRAETVAQLMLGAGLSYIALNYDKGYIVDETIDLSSLAYSNRKLIRDAAVAKLLDAAAMAKANAFATKPEWTNGVSYSNVQIAQIANTLAAITLAYYPRNAAENTAANWAQILTLTQSGMSSGTPVDFVFVGDGCAAWCHEILTWFDAFDTGRVHTRLANMMDPSQVTPYPAGGNPKPNSPDKRMGDGSFGDASIVAGFGTYPKTANAGTDFVWSRDEIFRPSRGSYHQSNIGHIRYDLSGLQDPAGIYGGFGPAPVVSAGQSELLWAEALIRTGGSLDDAATRINKTRVTRGGLAPASSADGVAGLTTKLGYEMEIEVLGLGASSYYWRRRTDGLLVGTPHEMPVPAKELGVKGEALYTWGGTGPANSIVP